MFKRYRLIHAIVIMFALNSLFLADAVSEEMKNNVQNYCSEIETICNTTNDMNMVRHKSISMMKSLSSLDNDSLPFLINEFKNKNKNDNYRYIVFTQIISRDDNRSIPLAIEALGDENDNVRACAASFSGKIRNKNAVNKLTGLLNDNNREVRIASCRALGEIREKRSIKPIINRFKKEKDFVVRTDIVSYSFKGLRDNNTYDQLIETLEKDPHPDVRASAAKVLGDYGNKNALSNLIKSLQTDRHPLVRYYAAVSLGTIGDNSMVAMLEQAMQDKSELVRQGVQSALLKLKSK